MGISIKNDKSQLTPRNVILICGLGLLLVYLVFGGNTETVPTGNLPATAPMAKSDSSSTESKTSIATRRRRMSAWKRLDFNLATAQKNDPFARLHETKEMNPASGEPDQLTDDETTRQAETEHRATK